MQASESYLAVARITFLPDLPIPCQYPAIPCNPLSAKSIYPQRRHLIRGLAEILNQPNWSARSLLIITKTSRLLFDLSNANPTFP